MTGQHTRRPETLRWMVRHTRVSGGRRAGMTAWVAYRYRWVRHFGVPTRSVEAVLGLFPTMDAAIDRARRDCAVFYDERSRP